MNTTNYVLLYSCGCKYDKLRIEKKRRKNCKFTDVKAFRRMEPERGGWGWGVESSQKEVNEIYQLNLSK